MIDKVQLLDEVFLHKYTLVRVFPDFLSAQEIIDIVVGDSYLVQRDVNLFVYINNHMHDTSAIKLVTGIKDRHSEHISVMGSDVDKVVSMIPKTITKQTYVFISIGYVKIKIRDYFKTISFTRRNDIKVDIDMERNYYE
ncbi:MAG: hypothetical protein ACOC5T_02035 [Elusimicrobiota bacterium]